MPPGYTDEGIRAAIAIRRVSERAVGKHVANIFGKFSLTPSDTDHRRVLAVLRYLGSGPAGPLPDHPGSRSP